MISVRARLTQGFFLFSIEGDLLISRLFRSDLKYVRATHSRRRGISDAFRAHVLPNADGSVPILTLGSTTFFWVRSEDVYVVAVAKCNANAALVFELLYRFQTIWRTTFRAPLCEEAVKKNFALVYEMLDEMIDFGYPQNGDLHALKMFIAHDDLRLDDTFRDDTRRTGALLPARTPWRRPDIRYRKNECYLDVVETLHAVVNSHGALLRADVEGRVTMRAHLSGMPECSVGLNADVYGGGAAHGTGALLYDCAFHPCVQRDAAPDGRTLTFVPVDGDFELMRYRASNATSLPLYVRAAVEETPNERVSYRVHVRAAIDANLQATQITVRIPTPRNTARARCSTQAGKARFEAEEHAILWRIPKLPGGAEYTLHADAALVTGARTGPWTRSPLELTFTVLMHAASGLAVRYLKVNEPSQYRAVKWVRYLTRATGTYLVRI